MKLADIIAKRALEVGDYTVENKTTVRETADEFGVSKSTIHKDIRDRLPELNLDLYVDAIEVLEYNKSVRHIRGGIATRQMFKELRKEE